MLSCSVMRKVTETLQPRDRREWREWLENNHDRASGVWLIYYKRSSGKQTLTYEEAVQEALSYGWIDGQAMRLDEERYKQRFSPRRKGSTWARSNKQRVAKLIEQGLMAPAGLAKVEEARKDGSWSRHDDAEDMLVPDELARALRARPGAEAGFQALPASKRKQLLWWLASAKRPVTRQKRIADTVELVAKGRSTEDYRG